MAARAVNLEWHRLQPDTVPMICAKSGVPTTRLRRHLLVQRRRIPWWMWFLVPLALLYLLAWAFGHRARIALPTTQRVRLVHWALRAVLLAWVLAGDLLVGSVVSGTWIELTVWIAGIVVLFKVQRAAWVAPQWRGMVRLRGAHPAFVSAVRHHVVVRPPVVPLEPEPEPEPAATPEAGWYPDPGGVHAARWYDGGAWTEHVMPHS